MCRVVCLLSLAGTVVPGAMFRLIAAEQPSGIESHNPLKWNGAGGCVVEFVQTPCRTVRYREYSFGRALGFDRISSIERIEAIDRAGSESNTMAGNRRRWWQLPGMGTTFRLTALLLRTEGRAVTIDHGHRVYETRPGGTRKGLYWEEDDSECSHTASHYLYLSGRLPASNIAGVNVVGYSGRDSRGADYEVYFAPSIGCQQMSFKMVTRGFLGLVTSQYHMVVDSYTLGPPEANLFRVPAGYKEVPSIVPFRPKWR